MTKQVTFAKTPLALALLLALCSIAQAEPVILEDKTYDEDTTINSSAGLIYSQDFDQYQNAAKRTLYGNEQVLTNCALGLAGESGQVVDLVKNYTFRGRKLDRQQLIHEMGDVLWYLSQIAEWADIPFDEVAKTNINELNKRYPQGFKKQD